VGRRLALLIAAVLVAALGTVLVFVYVQKADDRALADQKPVKVLVAKTAVSAGTRVIDAANAGSFLEKEIPASALVPGALSSIDPVKDQVALGSIFPGQQLLTAMFGATASVDAAIAIPAGQIAVSFSFNDPARVAGFVQPGSQVAVFVSYTDPTVKGPFGKGVRILLPKMTVIAVGPTTITPPADPAKANPEAQPRAMLTLAATQLQAEKLIFATNGGGSLYLGLLNDRSKIKAEPFGNPGITGENIFR
jgi:pilus assembly protein CpaB